MTWEVVRTIHDAIYLPEELILTSCFTSSRYHLPRRFSTVKSLVSNTFDFCRSLEVVRHCYVCQTCLPVRRLWVRDQRDVQWRDFWTSSIRHRVKWKGQNNILSWSCHVDSCWNHWKQFQQYVCFSQVPSREYEYALEGRWRGTNMPWKGEELYWYRLIMRVSMFV